MAKPLIETISFKLADGISTKKFLTMNKQMEDSFVTKQAGFISRETSMSDDGTWFINVHWQSKPDSDNSIASFDSAPGAKDFFALMDMDTFNLVQHQVH